MYTGVWTIYRPDLKIGLDLDSERTEVLDTRLMKQYDEQGHFEDVGGT